MFSSDTSRYRRSKTSSWNLDFEEGPQVLEKHLDSSTCYRLSIEFLATRTQ